jgi:hypothetical protein
MRDMIAFVANGDFENFDALIGIAGRIHLLSVFEKAE